MILLPIIFWGGLIGLFIYLINRRINIKKNENFEKRDN